MTNDNWYHIFIQKEQMKNDLLHRNVPNTHREVLRHSG